MEFFTLLRGIEGKHVVLQSLGRSGSDYFNYNIKYSLLGSQQKCPGKCSRFDWL